MRRSLPVVALLTLLCAASGNAEPYQVVTEEWAPYNYRENGRLTGMTTEIVQAIMALTGDRFEVTLLPSMRASHVLRTRPRMIMYSMFRTPEREPLYKWVGPVVEESIHAYQRGGMPLIDSLAQLRKTERVTTRYDGLIPDTLQGMGFTNLDKSATDNLQLYRMLMAGRTDVIVGDTDAGVVYYSRQMNIPAGTLRRIPVELYRASLYIAFSPDSDDIVVAEWRQALEQLRESGELARIQQRYEQLPSR